MPKRRITKRRRVNGEAEQSADAEPATETRHAVYRAPATYRGQLAGRRGVLQRHAEISLPPELHAQAEADGLVFVRWARGE